MTAVSLSPRIKYFTDSDPEGEVGVLVLLGETEKDTLVREVTSKRDFEKAFNCVDRGRALEVVRAHFPGLARWTRWCYGAPSRLLFGSHPIDSCAGVQQGDPLGPLLVAAAIHEVTNEL